jgi:hypothetical protein
MIGDNSVTNKYLDGDDDSSIDTHDVDDIHEIVRSHNLVEVKEAIAKDRPRLIAAKDEVRLFSLSLSLSLSLLRPLMFVLLMKL